MKNDISLHSIPASASLLEALDRLNSLSGIAPMVLFVVDQDGRAVGSLTDGDIRRAILAGVALDQTAIKAANLNFTALRPDGHDPVALLSECRSRGIMLVPRLSVDGYLEEIIDLRITSNRLPLRAILMAGGKGERLRPLTLSTPKPLLTIEGKPIIDYNVEALAASGISEIHVTTGYLAEQIHEHFNQPVAGLDVMCHRESFPMGTIGAASLINLPDDGNTLVMNSDLLTTLNYEEFFTAHRDNNADVTIAAIPYQVSVPFAILDIDNGRVTALSEKPTYSYFANAGIYIFRNSVLKSIDPSRRTDATELIEHVIANGGKAGYFPIKGTWIDVGSPADFRQASELMRHHKSFNTMGQTSGRMQHATHIKHASYG